MQRKLLLALVGAILASPTAFADSANVSIAGRIVVGVDTFKFSQGNAATARAYTNEQRVDDGGSAFTIGGSEDLGGGMKAAFLVTMPFQPDSGGFSSTGNSWLGLEGSFGKLRVGRDSIHYTELVPIEYVRAGDLQSFVSMGIGLQVNGTSAYLIIPTRTANLIEWQSPVWGGVTATVAYSTAVGTNEGSGVVANGSKGNGEHVAVRYVTADPLMGGVTFWKATLEQNVVPAPAVPNNDEKSQTAWVGYRFPFGLKAGLAANNGQFKFVQTADFTKRTAYIVPLTYSVGAHNFYLEYVTAGKTSGAFANGLATHDATGAKQWLLGWDMALSKRTFFGAYITKIDNDQNASYTLFSSGPIAALAGAPTTGVSTTPTTLAAGESTTHIWIGIAHSF